MQETAESMLEGDYIFKLMFFKKYFVTTTQVVMYSYNSKLCVQLIWTTKKENKEIKQPCSLPSHWNLAPYKYHPKRMNLG